MQKYLFLHEARDAPTRSAEPKDQLPNRSNQTSRAGLARARPNAKEECSRVKQNPARATQ